MRRFIKQTCAVALCAILAFEVMPTTSLNKNSKAEVSAEKEYDGAFKYAGREFHYRFDGSNIKLVYVEGSGNMILPSYVEVNGQSRKVTGLEYPFGHNQNISSITVPNTVTKIGNKTFYKSKIGKIRLSDNLETIGDDFCGDSSVDEIVCNSTKIKSIGSNPCNKMAKKTIVIGDWLIKCGTSQNVLDLSTEELSEVKHAFKGVFNFGAGVNTLRLGNNDALLKAEYFSNECYTNIANIYINGNYITPKKAGDTVPKMLADHYDLFDFSNFSVKYANAKAKLILNSMGITYYGTNNSFFKGTLSANQEYNILLKVHDYIVKNYTYNAKYNYSFYRVFNCKDKYTKCAYDAQMMALLLESAGVEAETVYSQEHIDLKGKSKEQALKENPDAKFVTYDGVTYEIGYDGNHCWNVVRIGGTDYFVDATNDRSMNWNSFLFFSDKYVNAILKNGDCCHNFSRYSNYDGYAKKAILYPFQQSKAHEAKVCKKSKGDVDMNGYTFQKNDADMLQAYCMLPQSIKNKVASTKDASKLTDAEVKTMNASSIQVTENGKKTTKYFKLVDKVNGKYKLLFSYEDLDVNFDNKIDMSDVLAISSRAK